MTHQTQMAPLVGAALALILATPFVPAVYSSPVGSGQDSTEWHAPRRKARVKNPIASTPESIAKGKALFTKSCVACHGDLGKGDGAAAPFLQVHPKDLSAPSMLDQTDGELYWKLSTGRTPMPAFETLHTSEERWMIVNYVRTLAPQAKVKLVAPAPGHIMDSVVDAYSSVEAGLAADNVKTTIASVAQLSRSIASLELVKPELLPKGYATKWKAGKSALKKAVASLEKAKTKAALRTAFASLSSELVPVLTAIGYGGKDSLRVIDCKMAFEGAGASWVQKGAGLANPYLGQKMPTCGTERATIKKAATTK